MLLLFRKDTREVGECKEGIRFPGFMNEGGEVKKNLFALFFLAAATLCAEDLTLEKALEIALRNNEQLKTANLKIQEAAGAVRESFGSFLPQASFSASFTKIPDVPQLGAITMGSENNYVTQFSVRQSVFTWGKIYNSYRISSRRKRAAELEFEKTKQEIILSVRKLFYSVLLSSKIEEISKEAKEVMERHFEVTEALYREGKVSSLAVRQVKVQLINAQTERINAENSLSILKKRFLNLINYDSGNEIVFSGELSKPGVFETDAEKLKASALKKRPELGIALLREENIKLSAKIIKAKNRPSITASYNRLYLNPHNFKVEWNWDWNASLLLNWPLFDGFSNSGKIRQVEAQLGQAASYRRFLEKNIILEVENALTNGKNALERVKVQQENAVTARKNLEIVQERYARGFTSDLELRDTSLALSKAEMQYFTALYDLNAALAELGKAVGRRLYE